jgi:hypothetical protein
MAGRGLKRTRTHDVDRLLEILEKDDCDLPPFGARLDELTQYAVPLRYDQLLDAEPLDRDATVILVDEVGRWAEGQLPEAPADDESAEETDEEERRDRAQTELPD